MRTSVYVQCPSAVLAAALTAALVSGIHADLAGTLTVTDRTEVRLRVYQGETVPGVDAVNAPGLRLDVVTGERVSYSLGYFPMFTLEDMEEGLQPLIFQTVSTGMSWRVTPRFRLSLGEDGSYGSQNYSFLTPTAAPTAVPGAPPASTPTLQLLPGAETLLYGSSRSSVSMQYQAARHLQITLTPTYFVGGGLDAASREAIPRQNAPRVELGIAALVDRRDSLTTSMDATDTSFTARQCDPTTGGDPTAISLALTPYATCKPHNDLANVSEIWRRQLGRTDNLAIGAGVTGAHVKLDPGGERNVLFPTAAVTLIHRFHADDGTHGELTADVRVAPIIDVRFGTIDQRAQAVLGCKWKGVRATYTLGVGATQSLPPSEAGAVTFIGVSGEALYAIGTDKRFDFGGGYRGAWQTQQPESPFFSNVFYAVFVYHEPAMRLWP